MNIFSFWRNKMSTLEEFITVTNLPEWIDKSPYIKEYKNDYPEEPYIIPKSKYQKYPNVISNENILDVLEIIRYYGIEDEDIFYDVFVFLFDIEPYFEYNILNNNDSDIGTSSWKNTRMIADTKIKYQRILNPNINSFELEELRLMFPEFKELWKNIFMGKSKTELPLLLALDLEWYSSPSVNNLKYMNRLFKQIKVMMINDAPQRRRNRHNRGGQRIDEK